MASAERSQPLSAVYVPVAVSLFVLAWLKGFRFPNLWSATHFAFNYSQGFVRRGLVGEIARQLGGDNVFQYERFVVLSFLIFFVVVGGFSWIIARAHTSDPLDLGLRIATLVFASSPGLVFFIHTIGYLDYLGVLFVIAALIIASRTQRDIPIFYLIIGISIISALIHEGLAVMFGPVLILAMGCLVLRRLSQAPLSRKSWLLYLGHVALASAILLSLSGLVSLIGVEDMDRVSALKNFVIAHADYPIRPKAFDALQRSSTEGFTRLMPWYWSGKDAFVLPIVSWQAFAPGFLWLLAYGLWAVHRVQLTWSHKWVLAVFFVGASISPLAFNFVGWDWGRWNGLALLSCFMSLLCLKLYFPSRKADSTPRHLVSTGLIAVAIGLTATTPLFDGFVVQFFPFQAHQDFVKWLMQDGFQYRPQW